jgi:hypothetical protein
MEFQSGLTAPFCSGLPPSDTIPGMSSHAVSQEQPGTLMGRLYHHDRPARRRPSLWQLMVVAALLVVACVNGIGVGPDWSSSAARVSTPLQSIGEFRPGQLPLALTGPRGITMAAGISDGRQRAGHGVEPGMPDVIVHGGSPSDGLPPAAARPAYLAAHGPFDVRAPPAVPA